MRVATWLVGSALVVIAVGSVLSDDAPTPTPPAVHRSAAPVSSPAPVATPPGQDVLRAAAGGDGDSWRDTAGQEYRLGLVNTPEVGECFAPEATAERVALVADGFRADVYAVDRYGRSVAVVTTPAGVDVNLHLARHGFADDRYVEQFRDENPALAARLDVAFAAARAESAGLWGACSSVKGDGSGTGERKDLDDG